MKIYAINGSPRKTWNTATLLQHALDGAKSRIPDASTELVNLYEHTYKGCTSCFQCKKLGGPSYGACAMRDGITPLLEEALHADALIFGSPIYFSDITGMLKCFLERLLFPCFVYDRNYSSLAPKKLPTAFLYTMNVPHEQMLANRYPERLHAMEAFLGHIFGATTLVQYVTDTCQFSDYSKYKMELFSGTEKAARRETQFPLDCAHARELGARLAAALPHPEK
ncbi:flavodoxin family protein [uncultured Desulfovibrio sp.]|uniref:flavodoxin family protein n=1 Tax=uncultured Desulfovibrio sp. TaxID=167968 RepID=UPI00280566C5|nr:flavodoxin family protein [uncultured Desulfovibrio sp.]